MADQTVTVKMKPQTTNTSLVDFIWKNADDLWGNFKHVDFGKVILPFTLLRRLEGPVPDCSGRRQRR